MPMRFRVKTGSTLHLSTTPAGVLLPPAWSHRSSRRHPDQLLCDVRMRVGNACVVHIVVSELTALIRLCRPPRSVVVSQLHDLVTNLASPGRHFRSSPADPDLSLGLSNEVVVPFVRSSTNSTIPCDARISILVIGDGIALAALGMQRFNPVHRNGARAA